MTGPTRQGVWTSSPILAAALALLVLPLALAPTAEGFVYWASPTEQAVGRANLDGTGVNPHFIKGRGDGDAIDPPDLGGAPGVDGVAVDADHIYWHVAGTAYYDIGETGRAKLNGTGIDADFSPGIKSLASGSVVDSTYPGDMERVILPPEKGVDGAAIENAWAKFSEARQLKNQATKTIDDAMAAVSGVGDDELDIGEPENNEPGEDAVASESRNESA